MSNNKFTIIRDTREKRAHGWTYEENAQCAGTLVETLRTGDYSVQGLEDFVCIERKETIQEFARNCVEKRWGDCMKRMSQVRHSYLILEFDWTDIDRYPYSAKVPRSVTKKMCWANGKPKIAVKYIWKVIESARTDYGIHVIACSDKIKAEKLAYRIMKKANEIYLRR